MLRLHLKQFPPFFFTLSIIALLFPSLKEDLEKRAENQDNVRKKDSRGRLGNLNKVKAEVEGKIFLTES